MLKLYEGSIVNIDHAFEVIAARIRNLNSGFADYINEDKEFIISGTFFLNITSSADTIKRHLGPGIE